MKSIIVLTIALAIACPSQAFLLDSISNAISSVTSSVSNTIDSIQSTLTTAQILGNFLWDNAFGPSWEMFLGLGADFIDNHFGSLLNGKRDTAQHRIQLTIVHNLFQTQATEVIAHFKSIFLEFIEDAKNTVISSIIPLVFGATTINDVMGSLLTKFRTLVSQAIQYASHTLNSALSVLGPEFSGLAQGLQQHIQNLGSIFNTELNAIAGGVINGFNGALSVVLPFVDSLKEYYQTQFNALMADVNKVLASALLGLLFGLTTVEDILAKILDTGKTYLVAAIQYTMQFAVQNFNALVSVLKPVFADTVAIVIQQLASLGLQFPPTLELGPVITNLISSIILP